MPLECNSDEYPNGIALHLSGQLTFDEMDEFRRVTDLALSHAPKVLALDLAGRPAIVDRTSTSQGAA